MRALEPILRVVHSNIVVIYRPGLKVWGGEWANGDGAVDTVEI